MICIYVCSADDVEDGDKLTVVQAFVTAAGGVSNM